MELTQEQLAALEQYADAHGARWKSKLNDDWMTGRTEGALQQIRNTFGSRWLVKFRFPNDRRNGPFSARTGRSAEAPWWDETV